MTLDFLVDSFYNTGKQVIIIFMHSKQRFPV